MSSFKPARRENTKLLLGLAAPTGGGKTLSALKIATGIVSVTGGKIALIDTENERSKQYAPSATEEGFEFEHADMQKPFSSDRYREMIDEAEGVAGVDGVIIIDSMSHEHTGPGGYLSWHDEEVERLCERAKQKGARYVDPDKYNYPAWAKPAAARAKLIDSMLRCKSHLIVCFRAKEKTKLVKGQIVDAGWQPLTGDELPYEMTTFCFLRKGVPDFDEFERGKLPLNMKKLIKPGPIDEDFGKRFIEWAHASQKPAKAPSGADKPSEHIDTGNGSSRSEGAAMLQQMGISHDEPEFIVDDNPGFGDEDPLDKARRLWRVISTTETQGKISDLVKQVMELGGLVPDETYEKLTNHLDAQSAKIREAERAA